MTRGARRWLRSAAVCGTLLAAAALALPAQQAAARPYDPPPAAPAVSLPDLLTTLQTLYAQTESATESYNKAKEAADQQKAKADTIDAQLADQRVSVADKRDEVGLMARQMYKDGSVSPYLSMLTGQTPQDFFGQRHVLDRAADHQQDVLDELTSGERKLSELNTQAQQALDKAQSALAVQQARKTTVERHLKQVESILAGLSGVQIDQLQTLEEKGVNKAQQDFLDSKALGDNADSRLPSDAGKRAIAYAFMQLGKPYVWGAQGPDSFDCSGLTSQSWLHAGVPIPRTSQEQWAQLPHVPLELLRPGDLVIYFSGATHVAIYIGNGLVIQAPRPGSVVKVSPIAANPILGAVRPDLGKAPAKDYTLPKIPEQAEQPTPFRPQVTPPAPRSTSKGTGAGKAKGGTGSTPPAHPVTPTPGESTPPVKTTPTPTPTPTGTPTDPATPPPGDPASPTPTATDGG
ncbi:NlpC/P60 family protein [Actinacidiphila alni]|uniref:NlpC/P60 family protein n=1 Tax=Actinacidiphila alni TaxID=380248 RepID=A0A1I2I5H7_9ACTN|nr:C40 family peptidase [Actinacidiphila alni]SFF36146.1 NlpC/P60 family protein [Actinacidiphila alni]